MSHKVFKSGLLLFAVLLSTLAVSVQAQTLSANLSGFVNDPDGAVIPNAAVVLTNQSSKDKRVTKANGSGFFTFTAVPAGTYTVEVQHAGFSSFVERDIELHPSDSLTLTDIKLPVGSVETTITVQAAASTIINQGEKSVLITADDIKRLPVQGRDVTELIKTLPGFAMTAQGTSADNLGPNSDTVGGQTQNYTANGASSQGVQILSDGVNITDPGNGAGSDQVINMDNVAEVKIQTSNFGADSAKGPIVINAVGKSGGSTYHGELYVYGRTYQLNTQDWFSKFDGDAKPLDREVYPGGNIGGPVRIPGTDFNHNRKLTFFASAEDYVQKNEYAYGSSNAATIYALVPTQAMRNGDFSAASLQAYFGAANAGAIYQSSVPTPPYTINNPQPGSDYFNLTNCNPNGALALYINICNVPAGNTPQNLAGGYPSGAPITNGQIPTNQFDPGTQAILNNLIPLPNTATFTANNGGVATTSAGQASTFESIYNYKQVNLLDDASYQTRARLDYAFSDSTKLYGTYNFQHSNGRNPQQLFYSPQTNFGEVDTPSGILGQDFSHVASLNFTKVFTPTLTNELFAGASLNLSGNEIGRKGANLSSSIGYPSSYQINGSTPGTKPSNQYPQLYDYGYDGLPLGLFPDYSSPIFQRKFTPNGGDNLTKLIKTHTIKIGVYVERDENNQTDLNVASNGQIENYYDGPNNAPGSIQQPDGAQYNSPGNYLASFFLGQVSAFQQYNFQTNSDLYYWNVAGFATDSWKVNKKLTLDYGLRLDHMGPWQDAHGIGFAVFSPTLYQQQAPVVGGSITVLPGVLNPGFTWHAINKNIPNSGAGSTLFFYSPRFGIAYDVYGDGKTFVRGGFGAYRSHDGWNDVNQEQATAQGQAVALVGGGGVMLRNVASLAAAGHFTSTNTASQSGTSGVGFGLQQGDTEQPLTYTYSFTVDQQVNPTTLFELSYQGSQTKHLLTQYEQGSAGDLANINAIPIGTLFHPDPITGCVNSPQGFAEGQPASCGSVNDFRPYPYYSQVNIARHILYANYNGLQVSLRKTQGRLLYAFNYTWSKDLGVLGSYSTGNVIDSTNIRPNYQPLAQDRSHVMNSTFSYDTGRFHYGSTWAKALLSSYDISGIINWQSGPDIQRVLGSNFNLGGQVSANGTQNTYNTFPINNTNILGTPDVVLQPAVTCPLTKGISGQHRYINGSCLAIPTYGVNGPAQYPYIHGPAFFNFDARISRQINLKGQKNLQFQLSAFNVINRPNYSFSSKYPLEQTLYYTGTTLAGAQAPSQFGQALYRFGRRVSEISIKYNF
jgi:hypothetical protein